MDHVPRYLERHEWRTLSQFVDDSNRSDLAAHLLHTYRIRRGSQEHPHNRKAFTSGAAWSAWPQTPENVPRSEDYESSHQRLTRQLVQTCLRVSIMPRLRALGKEPSLDGVEDESVVADLFNSLNGQIINRLHFILAMIPDSLGRRKRKHLDRVYPDPVRWQRLLPMIDPVEPDPYLSRALENTSRRCAGLFEQQEPPIHSFPDAPTSFNLHELANELHSRTR